MKTLLKIDNLAILIFLLIISNGFYTVPFDTGGQYRGVPIRVQGTYYHSDLDRYLTTNGIALEYRLGGRNSNYFRSIFLGLPEGTTLKGYLETFGVNAVLMFPLFLLAILLKIKIFSKISFLRSKNSLVNAAITILLGVLTFILFPLIFFFIFLIPAMLLGFFGAILSSILLLIIILILSVLLEKLAIFLKIKILLRYKDSPW